MNGLPSLETIARQAVNTVLQNVLRTRTVNMFFYRSPGNDVGGDRAIAGIDYQVRAQGFIIQRGRTGADGRIRMRVRGSSSTLELMHAGAAVAQYEVRVTTAAFAAVTTATGQEQRLRQLGYQIGHAGPLGNGVDGTNDMPFERSVLDFQVDSAMLSDANVSAAVRGQMTTDAGS